MTPPKSPSTYSDGDYTIILPDVVVLHAHRPLLYTADGKPLVKRMGF